MAKQEIKQVGADVLAEAKRYGLTEENAFFMNHVKIYYRQLKTLDGLERDIEENGATVHKEYVKGRKNIYSNPAIKEYNNTVNSLNGTVKTMQSIIKTHVELMGGIEDDAPDPLESILNGDV